MDYDPKQFTPGTSFTAETFYSSEPKRFLLLDDRTTVVEQTGVERDLGVIEVHTIRDVHDPND